MFSVSCNPKARRQAAFPAVENIIDGVTRVDVHAIVHSLAEFRNWYSSNNNMEEDNTGKVTAPVVTGALVSLLIGCVTNYVGWAAGRRSCCCVLFSYTAPGCMCIRAYKRGTSCAVADGFVRNMLPLYLL